MLHFSQSIKQDGGINIYQQKVRHFYLTNHHPPWRTALVPHDTHYENTQVSAF
jgi:hypothetical protein